jgi:hypothetical protein
MKVEVSFKVEQQILRCFVSGNSHPKNMLPYWQEMLSKCRKEKLNRLFVTLALRGSFDRFEALQASQSVITLLRSENIAIAVTDLNELSATDSKMACHMAVAKNINVIYVECEAEAKNWLNAQTLVGPAEFTSLQPCF